MSNRTLDVTNEADAKKKVNDIKVVGNTDLWQLLADAKKKVNDIKVVGNTDLWQLLAKASSKSEGWMKGTKAMEIPGLGVLIQASTQQDNNVAEALEFIPGAKILDDGGIKRIVVAK